MAKKAWRDGKFVIKTNTPLPAGEVVTSYKTLMNVERSFREIKNFLDVGPMYHWNEKRVRGHIAETGLSALQGKIGPTNPRCVWGTVKDELLLIAKDRTFIDRPLSRGSFRNRFLAG